MADAFVNRRSIPKEAFGVIPAGMPYAEWERRTEPFRRAVFEANGGKPVDKIFEHTGGENFPLLVSALSRRNARLLRSHREGLKGEYKETFFHDGRRFVMDARWVWMRQKQVLFRRAKPAAIFDDRTAPGRRVLVWGADSEARGVRGGGAGAHRGGRRDRLRNAGRARDRRTLPDGVPPTHILDRDGFSLPEEMPDPLTPEGRLNPEYASGFTRPRAGAGESALEGVRSARLPRCRRGPRRPGHAPLQHLRGAGFRRKGRLPVRGGHPSGEERPLHPGLPHVRRFAGRRGGAPPVLGEDRDGPGGPRDHGPSGTSPPCSR